MDIVKEVRRSLVLTLWFAALTFPIMVIRVNTTMNTIEWKWDRLVMVAAASFFGSLAWSVFVRRRARRGRAADAAPAGLDQEPETAVPLTDRLLARVGLTRDRLREPRFTVPAGLIALAIAITFPFVTSLYQTSIMISGLIYVILALGLNVVIGLGGMLHLGYAAFYGVGAYTYALLSFHFGVSFWVALPIGAGVSAIFGILLAIPVLRLRGDYLAIVTLGFGEIIRIVLTNWEQLSMGPSGIKNIARPGFFGLEMRLAAATTYMYFICLALVVFTVFIVYRLENSRIGRQLVAMGEDDVAARAMGVNTVRAKLTAFAIGAMWAGLAGVIFAARTTFINPGSFRVWESVLILSMVVLGGMGSIPGVVLGALILILMPEYLRGLSQYRLLIFGALLVFMMVFRPGGIVPKRRKAYKLKSEEIALLAAKGAPGDTPSGGPV